MATNVSPTTEDTTIVQAILRRPLDSSFRMKPAFDAYQALRHALAPFDRRRLIPLYIQNLLPSRSLKIAYLPPPHGASRSSTSNSTPFDLSSRYVLSLSSLLRKIPV